jgi:hypothetical protein
MIRAGSTFSPRGGELKPSKFLGYGYLSLDEGRLTVKPQFVLFDDVESTLTDASETGTLSDLLFRETLFNWGQRRQIQLFGQKSRM